MTDTDGGLYGVCAGRRKLARLEAKDNRYSTLGQVVVPDIDNSLLMVLLAVQVILCALVDHE